MKKVQNITLITTIMEIIGVCLMIFVMVIAALLFVAASALMGNSADYLQNGVFSDLMGGFEVLGGLFTFGGSILGMMVAVVLLFACGIMVVFFLVPSIHGIVIQINTKKYLEKGIETYVKNIRRDAIIKIVFNAVPGSAILIGIILNGGGAEVLVTLWFALICVLEGLVLKGLGKEL